MPPVTGAGGSGHVTTFYDRSSIQPLFIHAQSRTLFIQESIVEKKLVPDATRAKSVRDIFELFALTGSLKKTFDFARKEGMSLTLNGIFHVLRNPTYIGQMVWGGKIYRGNHKPIISRELFGHAQSLTREKPFKKRLYKEYLLAGLLKCAECGSTMTPTFSNKKARRYYYYKCYKVVREGKSACGIKEVSAERLEEFLIENLSRIAQDKQYIDNLAFKMAHKKGGPAGVHSAQSVGSFR